MWSSFSFCGVKFNGRGLAELARLILVDGGIRFEDVRVNSLDELKSSDALPFNQVPILQVGKSKTIAQSVSIARYAAKLAGLYPRCPQYAAESDMIVDLIGEVRAAYRPFYSLQAEAKDAFLKNFMETTVPKYLALLEKSLGSNQYFVAGKPSIADFAVFQLINDSLLPLNNNLLDSYPSLKGLVDRIGSRPRIAEYLRNRPQTAF